MCRKMFSSTTTELSIRRENTSAKPAEHHVLIEPPPMQRAMNAASADSGIDKNTATVARKLPRNTRIMSAVRAGRCAPSCSSVSIAFFTNTRLIEHDVGDQLLRHVDQLARQRS